MKIRLIIASLMLFFACSNTIAQQAATVKNFTMTTDHIPSGDRRNDMNGVPCALVKVQVIDDIERIEGNKIGDIVNKGVEKWVYMCKGSRNMRIHFKNHLPVRVMFHDYNINGLESNRVYELTIEASSVHHDLVDVKGNNLQMKIHPQNATVYIWGDNMEKKAYRPQNDGTIKVFLPYGRYHYSAKANGYNDAEGSVFVNDEIKWEEINMTVINGIVDIRCSTPNIDYYINGTLLVKDKNESSWHGQLLPGQYTIQASRKGYISKTKDVTINANETTTVDFENLVTMDEQRRILERQKKEIGSNSPTRPTTSQKVTGNSRIGKNSQKNVAFGITGGLNMATAQFSDKNNGKTKQKMGFYVGFTTDFILSNTFTINTGLLYSAKGYSYENRNNDVEETADPQYLEIPVQASINFPLGDTFSLVINAGPYAGFCIGGKVKDEYWSNGYDESFSSAYNSFDYGFQAGINIDILYHFQIKANYQLGLSSDYPNRNIMIGVGYRF